MQSSLAFCEAKSTRSSKSKHFHNILLDAFKLCAPFSGNDLNHFIIWDKFYEQILMKRASVKSSGHLREADKMDGKLWQMVK